ncbi:MAG: tetratricopeptide repeat protein [Leptolyngbyaceae cyanobacterium]
MGRKTGHDQWGRQQHWCQLVGSILGSTMGLIVAVYPLDLQALTRPELQQRARGITVLVDGLNPGSGVIVAHDAARSQYWVLTAQHVVATEDEYWIVTPDGQEYWVDYRTVRKLPGLDLALVAFESSTVYPVAVLADYPQSQTFPYVVVSGWTGSNIYQEPIRHEFAVGQLLRRRYGMLYAQQPFAYGYGMFYTSITEQGMSGGPILDTAGRVIGIHGRSEGEEHYLPDSGTAIRLHWGFSSGIPLPTPATLTTLTDGNPRWQWQTAPPDPITPTERRSLATVTQFVDATPDNGVSWTNRGNQLYRLEEFGQAIAAFEAAIALQPDFYQAWYGMAQVLTTQGRYEEALEICEHILTLQPDFYQAMRDRALLWVLQGNLEQAVVDFDQVVQHTPSDYVAWYLRGNLFWKHMGWDEAALGSYDRALSIAPTFAEAWIERGRVLQRLGYEDEAIASLKKAIGYEPDLAGGWYWLALFSQDRDPNAALTAIEQAVAIVPTQVDYLFLYSQLLIQTGQSVAAHPVLERILAIDPNHQSAQASLQRLTEINE